MPSAHHSQPAAAPDGAASAALPGVPRSPGSDIVRFGTAIAAAVALGVVQVFVLPRRMDVTTYGQYRLYLVYFGYLGLLNFGLADGAFVRWAGKPPGVIHQEWRTVFRWLLGVQGALLAVALAAALVTTQPLPRIYILAFAASALCANVATLAGYALQAAGDFRGAGQIAVLAPLLYVGALFVLPLHTLAPVLTAHVATAGIAAIVGAILAARVTAGAGATPPDSPLTIRLLLHQGLPVLGANLAAGISQSADRILVSVSVPITSLALYGFASSVSVAAGFATQTLSRVVLSHAARRGGSERAHVLAGMYDVIAAGFGVALAGLPLFEHVVARALPAYVPALPIVRALVCGSFFTIAIHVVLVGTLQSYGLVRRQFALELGGAALLVSACAVCLAAHAPLWVVATATTCAAFVTWAAGVALVQRSVPDAHDQRSLRFLLIGAAQMAALLVSLAGTGGWIARTLAYAALALVPTALSARAAQAQWRR